MCLNALSPPSPLWLILPNVSIRSNLFHGHGDAITLHYHFITISCLIAAPLPLNDNWKFSRRSGIDPFYYVATVLILEKDKAIKLDSRETAGSY